MDPTLLAELAGQQIEPLLAIGPLAIAAIGAGIGALGNYFGAKEAAKPRTTVTDQTTTTTPYGPSQGILDFILQEGLGNYLTAPRDYSQILDQVGPGIDRLRGLPSSTGFQNQSSAQGLGSLPTSGLGGLLGGLSGGGGGNFLNTSPLGMLSLLGPQGFDTSNLEIPDAVQGQINQGVPDTSGLTVDPFAGMGPQAPMFPSSTPRGEGFSPKEMRSFMSLNINDLIARMLGQNGN